MTVFSAYSFVPKNPDGLGQGREQHINKLQDTMVAFQRHDMVVAQLLRRSSEDAAALRRRMWLDIDVAFADFSDAMSAALTAYSPTEELRVLEEALNRRVRAIETAAARTQELHAKALARALASARTPNLNQYQE